ncbi:MAG: monovalent cation/H(+) antiporter subunit G [Actinomycetota bacterium]
MNPVAAAFILVGSLLLLLASIGLLKFSTPYARFHAAGKASPVAVIVVSIGAIIELGASGGARLAFASVAMTLTLPVAVHLLFRSTHRTNTSVELRIDELREAEEAAERGG